MEPKEMYKTKVEQFVTHGAKVFFMILIVIFFAFLMGYVVMWLWNWLMPQIFGLPIIGYWQAIGLLALAKILFGLGNHSSKNKGNKKMKRRNMEDWCKSRSAFSDWKHYEDFWKDEGQEAFQAYVERKEKSLKDEKE